MQQLLSTKKILLTSILLPSIAFSNPIGDITEKTGVGALTRNQESVVAEVGGDIILYDLLETGNGRLAVEFQDDSALRLTEHSEVLIDEVIFDPNPGKGKMVLNFAMGTARFTTGKMGLVDKQNIAINTPTAQITIRGTDFTSTVDELGRSLVILLPLSNGDASGEIVVTNDAGSVTLTEAYQATMVSTINSLPTEPVIIEDINVQMIDNMFIVSPPTEVKEAQEEQATESGDDSDSILDFNDLDIDYLKEDWDEGEGDLEFSELDMDLLDVDFLQDVLKLFEEVNLLKQKQRDKGQTGSIEGNIIGTALGFDKTTQYNTIIDDSQGQIWFYREVNGVIDIRVPIESGVKIESENEGVKNSIIVNDGDSVIIIIKQSG